MNREWHLQAAQVYSCRSLSRATEFLRELRRLTVHNGTRKVLLVDDNEVSRYILRDLLNQPWLEIREAANGICGLECAQREHS